MNIRLCVLSMCLATPVLAQDMPLSQIIIPGEGWKKVEGEFKPIRFLTCYDGKTVQIWDGLYELQGSVDARTGKAITQSLDGALQADRFSVGNDSTLIVDRKANTVRFEREVKGPKWTPFKLPVGEVGAAWMTNDRGTLLIGDASGKHVWTYRVGPQGLSAGEKYMTLRVAKGEERSEVSDIRIDPAGRFFVATKAGIQVFDPTGRLCGVLSSPSKQRPTSIVFSGPQLDVLFVACGGEIFYRVLQAKGVAPVEKKGPGI